MKFGSFVAFALVFSTSANAGLLPPKRSYHRLDMFAIGYKDKVQSDGTWRILANSRPNDGPNFAIDMALYRAAELTIAAGKPYFQILNQSGTVEEGLFGRGKETMKLIVRASDSSLTPSDCRSKQSSDCFTLQASQIIDRIGPTLVKK